MFVPSKFFQASIIFAQKVRAYQSEAPYVLRSMWFLGLFAHIRRACKTLPGTNTLAYFGSPMKKRFITLIQRSVQSRSSSAPRPEPTGSSLGLDRRPSEVSAAARRSRGASTSGRRTKEAASSSASETTTGGGNKFKKN